ncbi:MAG TPA: Bax inhibitor-1/YccA family protein [Phycisphaerae bacterium]|nr:Bax inhibitor-1/YccA family protein [Phycisphaerae bacterium]
MGRFGSWGPARGMYDPAASGIQVDVQEQQKFITKVYSWMTIGLAITGFVGLLLQYQPQLVINIAQSGAIWIIFLVQLGLVVLLSFAIRKISASIATLLFLLYSASVGFTIALVFLAYTTASIAGTFFITAGTFGAMAFYGYVTKRDLSSIGNILFMGLIGVLIAMIVNVFLHSPGLYYAISLIGVLVFVGLTAYDNQRIKYMYLVGADGSEANQKAAIMGALQLYLDFINLFLFLLRLFGQQRR